MLNDPSQEQGEASLTDRRREASRVQQIQRRRRVAFAVIAVLLLVVVVGVIGVGYTLVFVLPPQERVVSVNDVTYTRGDMVKMLRIRQRLIEDSGQRIDTSTDIFQALQLIVENEIISQSAPSIGITVSDEEVDQQIQATIIFQAGGQLAGKSDEQLDREFKELYGNFLNSSQISEDEHRDIVRRTLLREKVRQYVGESVPRRRQAVPCLSTCREPGRRNRHNVHEVQGLREEQRRPAAAARGFQGRLRASSREKLRNLCAVAVRSAGSPWVCSNDWRRRSSQSPVPKSAKA